MNKNDSPSESDTVANDNYSVGVAVSIMLITFLLLFAILHTGITG